MPAAERLIGSYDDFIAAARAGATKLALLAPLMEATADRLRGRQ